MKTETELHDEIKELNERIEDLEGKISGLQRDNESLEEANDDLDDEKRDLQSKLDELEDELDDVELPGEKPSDIEAIVNFGFEVRINYARPYGPWTISAIREGQVLTGVGSDLALAAQSVWSKAVAALAKGAA